uniref:Uncharacterized protein n=1 Tax=Arundo donax TaxID=35708 RepID=A0A0A9ALU2_ARUDO
MLRILLATRVWSLLESSLHLVVVSTRISWLWRRKCGLTMTSATHWMLVFSHGVIRLSKGLLFGSLNRLMSSLLIPRTSTKMHYKSLSKFLDSQQ